MLWPGGPQRLLPIVLQFQQGSSSWHEVVGLGDCFGGSHWLVVSVMARITAVSSLVTGRLVAPAHQLDDEVSVLGHTHRAFTVGEFTASVCAVGGIEGHVCLPLACSQVSTSGIG